MPLLDDNNEPILPDNNEGNEESTKQEAQTPPPQTITKSFDPDDPRYNNNIPTALKSEGYEALSFIPHSLRFLTLFDSALRAQAFTLHRWQAEVNEDVSRGITRNYATGEILSQRIPDSIHPYKFALCAANGSGKDAFFIAPFALWFIVTKIKAKVIITSSSGTQLTTQTEHYISTLAKEVNNWAVQHYGQEIIKIRKRHIACLLSGSVIHMFATDEGEKAEGHHPTAPGCEMAILVNEAKSVSKEIFDALRRCTGYNYWIDVSSPGQPQGEFFKHFKTWPNKRRISYFDCPHQSPDEFETDRIEMGEHDALFRSKWLALFTPIGGKYVVDYDKLDRLLIRKEQGLIPLLCQDQPIRIGIDIALSTNGDETVISAWKGNKQLDQKCFRIQDATILAEAIHKYLSIYVPMDHHYIFADDGGVGRPVIDILNRRGYKINRVLNNSVAKDKKKYRNKGAQLWYKFARWIELGLLIFQPKLGDKLYAQIQSRKYADNKISGGDVLQLESKKDMMAEGLPSPDRADAAVLAFTDVPIKLFLEAFTIEEGRDKSIVKKTSAELIKELMYNMRYNKAALTEIDKFNRKRIHGSLQVALRRQTNNFII